VDSIRHLQEEEESKNHPIFVPPQPGTDSKPKVQMLAPPGRPMIKFVDIAGKFVNKHESLKRIKKAAHRTTLKAKRRKDVLGVQKRMIQEERRVREARRETANVARAAAKKEEKSKYQPGDGRSLILS
jgi:hypothetical protein